jgi:hypothetical protein
MLGRGGDLHCPHSSSCAYVEDGLGMVERCQMEFSF